MAYGSVRIGDLPITLVVNIDRPSGLEHSEHAMATMFLEVDDHHAAYEQAITHDDVPVDPPQTDGVHFIVTDPDGIIIEVM